MEVNKYGKKKTKKIGNDEYVAIKEVKTIKIWRKAHLFTLPRTNAVLAVVVTPGNVSDARHTVVEKLISKPAKKFNITQIIGDKAYSSRALFQIFSKLGLTPFIPFKKGVSGNPRGVPMWRVMYDYFYEHTETFMVKYHPRSNIETTNSMIKTKLGHRLRTRMMPTNSNEIKAKVLCHNLCVLIREIFESDLKLDFAQFSVKN